MSDRELEEQEEYPPAPPLLRNQSAQSIQSHLSRNVSFDDDDVDDNDERHEEEDVQEHNNNNNNVYNLSKKQLENNFALEKLVMWCHWGCDGSGNHDCQSCNSNFRYAIDKKKTFIEMMSTFHANHRNRWPRYKHMRYQNLKSMNQFYRFREYVGGDIVTVCNTVDKTENKVDHQKFSAYKRTFRGFKEEILYHARSSLPMDFHYFEELFSQDITKHDNFPALLKEMIIPKYIKRNLDGYDAKIFIDCKKQVPYSMQQHLNHFHINLADLKKNSISTYLSNITDPKFPVITSKVEISESPALGTCKEKDCVLTAVGECGVCLDHGMKRQSIANENDNQKSNANENDNRTSAICQYLGGCEKYARSGSKFCINHGAPRKSCQYLGGCEKWALSPSTFCSNHGAPRKSLKRKSCQYLGGCEKWARSGSKFCVNHGAPRRTCQYLGGCKKWALSPSTFCVNHGAPRKSCQYPGGCEKWALSPSTFCSNHGAPRKSRKGKSCQYLGGCEKWARSGSNFCSNHGAPRKSLKRKSCQYLGGCEKWARSGSKFCVNHGAPRKSLKRKSCQYPGGCDQGTVSGSNFCSNHSQCQPT